MFNRGGFKYAGYLDYFSNETHRYESIECGIFDTPEECHEHIGDVIDIVKPMEGFYSTCVVEFRPVSVHIYKGGE